MNTTSITAYDSSTPTAAQKAAAEESYSRVTLCLRDHPCVSFALSCGSLVHWSPELDAAVRLMQMVTYGDLMPTDQAIVDLQPSWVTPERVEAAENAVIDCISLLKTSGHPFTLLAHVDGHSEVEYHFARNGQEFPLATIADAVAAEVACFGRG
jgi:hypothetical protein